MKVSVGKAFCFATVIAISSAQDLALSENESYIDWLGQASYGKSTVLSSTRAEGSGVALHWTTDDTHIHLAVAGLATGWIGFGLAESGSMRGADIIMFTAETNELVDSYVLDQLVTPLPDECQSWILNNSTVAEDGLLLFEASRLLDTGDTQDRAIIDDSNILVSPSRVIAAWGDTPAPSFHGVDNTARASVRFFGSMSTAEHLEAFASDMAVKAEGNFTIQARDFAIPGFRETTYAQFCLSRAELLALGVPLDQDLHTIGMEPFVDSRTQKYVHHFVLYGSTEPWDSSFDCDAYPTLEVAFSWAPGGLPLSLPDNVGGPLGGPTGFQSFALETHYDNVDSDQNKFDSSGVRFFYTSQKRQHDMGIFQTGDPGVALFQQPVSVNGGLTQHVFLCEDTCSSNFVTEPVTVITEALHMHQSGASMVNDQIRNGEVLRTGAVDYWDFFQQGGFDVVQAPFDIQPGDSFRTTCNFNATAGEVWGLASQDEMCIAFLYYYPRKLSPGKVPYMCGIGFGGFLPGCDTTHVVTPDFNTVAQLERTFGPAPVSCPTITVADAPTITPAITQTLAPVGAMTVGVTAAGPTASPSVESKVTSPPSSAPATQIPTVPTIESPEVAPSTLSSSDPPSESSALWYSSSAVQVIMFVVAATQF